MVTVSTTNRTPSQQAALEYLRQRRQGYLHTFKLDDRFANIVLADLAAFCRASESTFHPDARVQCMLEGRREVWLRLMEHLNLSEEDLLNLKLK